MTLGNAAAAKLRLIVWCRDCRHRVDVDPAAQVARCGADTTLPFEKQRLASIETKAVSEFEKMTDEELDAEIARMAAEQAGGIGARPAPRRAPRKPH